MGVNRFNSVASVFLYDDEGNQYPVNNVGQLYVPLEFEQAAIDGETKEETINQTKN